ncbi:TonB-dependent receptor plug domain-containing protein [Shewanella youngdeokensis]|uniref:TonB-dependent receptor n=1 Tax=Shewanella youngdeokensis TaxID=2999068 RepID=A0ABZ0K1X1_9GAMM|nr:TonB-dependent receptor [Shewanella sp. DAU334]
MFQIKPTIKVVALALGTLVVTPASAQEQLVMQAPDAVSNTNTETMVVTGTRSEQLLEKVPSAIEVFSSDDIIAMGATSVKDVIGRASGAQIYSQKGGINLRGIGFNYTVVLVNGRKPGAMENNKDFQNYITESINLANVERIEVLRGQAGSMYGSNAIGGVINIITKNNREELSTFGVTHGNYETKTTFSHDFGLQGDVFGRVSGAYKRYIPVAEDDLTTAGKTAYSVDGDMYNIDGMVGYVLDNSHELRLEAGYSEVETISKTNSFSTDDDGFLSPAVSNRYAGKTIANTAMIFDGYSEDHSYSASLGWNQVEVANYDDSTVTHYDVFSSILADVQDEWIINDYNTLVIGADYLRDNIDRPDVELAEDVITRYAAYAQNQMSFFDDTLMFIPSVRFDNDSAFGNKVTYQFGTTYEFVRGHYLKANYGTGYKAPTLTELYSYETQGNGTVWGNPDLKPEESTSFDVRYEFFGERLTASVGYYKTELTDKFSSTVCTDMLSSDPNYAACQAVGEPINGGDSMLRINVLESNMQGIEAEVAYQLTENLNLKASLNYLDGEQLDEDGIWGAQTFTAEQVYGLDMQYYHPELALGINAWGAWNKDYLYTSTSTPYDFYNFNLSVTKEIGNHYSVSFAAYNLLQSTRDTTNDSAVEPMEWRLNFQAKF